MPKLSHAGSHCRICNHNILLKKALTLSGIMTWTRLSQPPKEVYNLELQLTHLKCDSFFFNFYLLHMVLRWFLIKL